MKQWSALKKKIRSFHMKRNPYFELIVTNGKSLDTLDPDCARSADGWSHGVATAF